MRSFFNSLQTNRNKYVGSPSPVNVNTSNTNLNTSTTITTPSSQNRSSGTIDLNQSSSSSSNNSTALRLDSTNLIPFLDILEQTVKQKITQPNILIEIKDNPQMMSIVNQFIAGGCNKLFLEKHTIHDLWSAVIKIINISDPILSAASCDSLQRLNYSTMNTSDPSNPILSTNHEVANHLPIHHQRLLGALFSASDMIIRLDANCASTVAGSIAKALIWNSAPGSPSNHQAFCSFIHNQCENFPYYYTFADRVGLLVKPVESNEWMAILTEGNSGVIVGYSAALNPDYRHNPGGESSMLDSNTNSLMKSVDLSTIPGNSRIEILEEKPWLPSPTNRGVSRRVRAEGGVKPSADDTLLSFTSPNSSALMLGVSSADKRSNTPLTSDSLESSPASVEKRSTLTHDDPHPINASAGSGKYTFPVVSRMSPGLDSALPSNVPGNNSSSAVTTMRGIAMGRSSESLTVDQPTNVPTNRNTRTTEGRYQQEESWDDNSLDDIPAVKAMDKSNPRSTGTPQISATNSSSRQSSPSIYVKLKDLQNVFSSSLVSASSLEYRSFRNLDYSEDYADLKSLKKNIEVFIGNRHLTTLLETGKFSTAKQGFISWSDFLQVALTLLSDSDRDYIQSNRITYDDDLPAELTQPKPTATAAALKSSPSIYDDFDDDSIDEIDGGGAATTIPTSKAAASSERGSNYEGSKGGRGNSAYYDHDADTSTMQLDRSMRAPLRDDFDNDENNALEESNSSFISIPELPTKGSSLPAHATGITRRKTSSWDDAKPTSTNNNKGLAAKSILEDDNDSDSDEERKPQTAVKAPSKPFNSYYADSKAEAKRAPELKSAFSSNTIPHHADVHSDLEDEEEELFPRATTSKKGEVAVLTTESNNMQRKASNNSNHSMSNYSTFSLTESTVSNLTGSVASNVLQNSRRESRIVSSSTPTPQPTMASHNYAEDKHYGGIGEEQTVGSGGSGNSNKPSKWKKRVDLANLSEEDLNYSPTSIENSSKPVSSSQKPNEEEKGSIRSQYSKLSFISEPSPGASVKPKDDSEFDFAPDGGDESNPNAKAANALKAVGNKKGSNTFSLTSIDAESDSPNASPQKPPLRGPSSSFFPLKSITEETNAKGRSDSPRFPFSSNSGQGDLHPAAFPTRVLSTDSTLTGISTEATSVYDLNQLEASPLELPRGASNAGDQREPNLFETISLDSPEKITHPPPTGAKKEKKPSAKSTAKSIIGFFTGKKKDKGNAEAINIPETDQAIPSNAAPATDPVVPLPVTASTGEGSRRPSLSSDSTVASTAVALTPANAATTVAPPAVTAPPTSITSSSGNIEKPANTASLFSKMKDAFKLPSLSRNASPSRPAADTNTTTGTTITSSSISSDPAAALSTVPPLTTTAAPQPGSRPSKFPFLSSGNKSTSSEQLRSSGRIELNAIDVDAPASKDSIPLTTVPTSSVDARLIAEAKSDTKIVDPPLPEKIQQIETAVIPPNNLAIKADEKSDVNKPMKLPNPAISKKPTLSVAAAVQIKQQQQQQQLQSQEKLTPRDMDPSLVMINDEKPSDFGFRALPTVGAVGTGGIGIAEKGLFAPDPSEAAPVSTPGTLSINTTAIKDELPPPYHRSSTPTALTQKQGSSRYNSSSPNLDSTSTSVSFAPNIIDQAPPAAESPDAAPSVTRPESTTNPPRPQRSLSFNNRPMSMNSNRKFLSGRGLASRIRKNSGNSNTVSPREGYLPSNATNPQSNSIETATGESNAQKRLAQLLQRSQTVNQSLAAHQTSFPNLQQLAKGEEPKRQTMADRLIHDMKSLYKQRHSEEIGSSSNSPKDDRVGGDANRTKHLSFGLFSGIGQIERGRSESDAAHTLDSTETEDPLPLLQSYWHQLKDTITPRSLFLTPKDFDYFQTLITAAKPDVDIEAIMKKKAIFHSSSQPIYKYDELNRYYDEVHTFHQSPLVKRMLAIIEQQEKVQEDLLAKQQQPASDSPFSPNNNNKKQRVITPIHYIPDPLFGIHIFNTNLLFSHLDEFLRQKQKTQQQKNQLLLDKTEPLIQSPPSNYVVTASAHTHVRYQMNPQVLYNVIHQNLFYTELQSILAIKYSGFLQKYLLSSNPTANTRFKQRFFTLMVVPIKNPNIRAAFKLPPVVSSNTIDGGEEREEQVQEEWEYILVEYRRMSESSWGNIPLQFKRFYYLKDLLYIFIDSNKGKEGKEFTICFRITTESATELDLPLPTDRKVMKHVANLENVKDIPPLPASNSTITITKPAEHGRLERQKSVGKRESGTTSNLKDAVAKIDAIDAPGTVLSVDTASKIDDVDAKRKSSLERRNSKSKITQTANNAKPTNNPPLSDNPKSTPADGKAAKEDPEDDDDDGDEEEDEIFGDDDEDENENPVAPSSYHYRPGTTIPTNDAPPPLTPVSSTNPLHPSPEINQIIQNKKIKHDRWIKVTLLANSANERVQWVQILQSVAPANVYINTLNYQ